MYTIYETKSPKVTGRGELCLVRHDTKGLPNLTYWAVTRFENGYHYPLHQGTRNYILGKWKKLL